MAESRIPRLMELAPDFEAVSTHGLIRLTDYTSHGRWVLLFSHPSDFTPVCSTEFIEFARRQPDWDRLNLQLLAVSIDSLPAHIAWVLDLERISGLKIAFPIVADLDQRVSQAYGLVHEAVSDTAAVRAVFVIDPRGLVRALLYYPIQVGRNLAELVRLVEALQLADTNAVSCPADWLPGDPVLAPAPTTVEEAIKRTEGATGLDVQSWYLSTRALPVK